MEKRYHIFIGGMDKEMEEIKRVAESSPLCAVYDKALKWDTAKASEYEQQIWLTQPDPWMPMQHAQVRGFLDFAMIPVLIELEVDCDLPEEAIIIDHHGARAGELPAIIQFLNLLGIKPSREQRLIGAHDAAWVPGLIALGATMNEISKFLNVAPGSSIGHMLAEHARKFLSPEEIIQSEKAVENSIRIGDLILVKCQHSKCGLITALCYDRQVTQNLLIISDDGEVNYYGPGEKVKALKDRTPGGWSGGAGLESPTKETLEFWGGNPPNTAFWGHNDILWPGIVNVLKRL